VITPTKTPRTWYRVGILVVILTVSYACAGVPAEYQESRLALQHGGLSGYKYTFDGSEPAGVYNFFGLYQPSFVELMSQQPDALAVSRRAQPLMYASLGVTLLSTAYGVSEFVAFAGVEGDDLAATDEKSEHLTRAVAAVTGGVILGAILRIPVKNRLYEAVGMFNEGLESPDDDAQASNQAAEFLPNSLRVDPTSGRVDLGWHLRH